MSNLRFAAELCEFPGFTSAEKARIEAFLALMEAKWGPLPNDAQYAYGRAPGTWRGSSSPQVKEWMAAHAQRLNDLLRYER